jgi:PTH1 family peptidyl-tRNA hydrolase
MYAIVGLGNPGKEYAQTRHNIGFMVVDSIANELGAISFKNEHGGQVAKARLGAEQLILVKPQTYMNRSGDCVGMLGGYYKLTVADFLIICDDMDLPLGSVRLRQQGGSGGHNGLKSVQAAFGTDAYCRLRLGIGRRWQADEHDEVVDHVLGRFSKVEADIVRDAVLMATKAAMAVFTDGIIMAMNKYNPLGKIIEGDSQA